MLGAVLGQLEAGGADEDRLAVLDATAPRGNCGVAQAVGVVDDRRSDVAGAQEIGVHRMRHAGVLVERLLRGRERLPQHLAAEHVFGADVAALAAEQGLFQAFQREQLGSSDTTAVDMAGFRKAGRAV